MRSYLAAVVGGLFFALGGAAVRAEPSSVQGGARILDLGLRPIVSFPDAIGLNVEIHPFGGGFAIEGGLGFQPLQSVGPSLALKHRFTLYDGKVTQLSIGPGIGWLAIYDGPSGPLTGQLVSAFAATEAVFWGERIGFRLALDVGAAHPIHDEPGYSKLGTFPVFNGSVGLAFRTKPVRSAAMSSPFAR
jgi:hypothetical protein